MGSRGIIYYFLVKFVSIDEIFGTRSQNISKNFIKIIEDEELEEKEVSISSKKLFENQNEFINYEF